eukprot:4604225-Amphidinium_carterae.1
MKVLAIQHVMFATMKQTIAIWFGNSVGRGSGVCLGSIHVGDGSGPRTAGLIISVEESFGGIPVIIEPI